MQTVVELPEYIQRASRLLSESEKKGIINYLASPPPQSAAIMQSTGGIRKFRWASGNKGKSGGVRVIYYYHNKLIPLFLLTVFGKNEKDNLSKSERNELTKFDNLLSKNYGEPDV